MTTRLRPTIPVANPVVALGEWKRTGAINRRASDGAANCVDSSPKIEELGYG